MKYNLYTVSVLISMAIYGLGQLTDNPNLLTHDFETPEVSISIDSTFDVEAALADIKEKIKGRENDPAEEVFKNIQIMKGFPAGRIPAIMQFAFNNSLGVNCTHCHNPDDWSNDDKPTKKVTREMWKMVGTINTELLANINNLESQQPVVNCTTCHRGEIKPALNLSK